MSPFTHAAYYGYRTSLSVLRRHLAGDRAPDGLLRVVALHVIGWGC